MFETYIKRDNLYILGTVTSPGVPASYLVLNYFVYSKNNFIEIKDNIRLYEGIEKEFISYCKSYFPELYKLFCETRKKDNMNNIMEDSIVTFDEDNKYKDLPIWKQYNEIIDNLVLRWENMTGYIID